jgi:glycosyltransferase involved in cell wall biosynthesis
VIESMAMGKPVVAFAVGGVIEMVDSEVGELVAFEPAASRDEGASPQATARLADAMVRYVCDPALRTRQGAAARERVLREFDARAHARSIQREIVAAAGLAPALPLPWAPR